MDKDAYDARMQADYPDPPMPGRDHKEGRYHVVRPFGLPEEENFRGASKAKKHPFYVVVGSGRNELRAVTGHASHDEALKAAIKITRVNLKYGLEVLVRVIDARLIDWS